MKLKYKYYFILILFIFDIISLILSANLSFKLLTTHQLLEFNLILHQSYYILISCWIASAGLFRLYYSINSFSVETIYRCTFRTFIFFNFLLFLVFYIDIHNTSFVILHIILSFILFSFLSISRFLLTVIYYKYKKKYSHIKSVGIIGFNILGIKLSQYFESHPYEYNFIGILDENIQSINFNNIELQNHIIKFINFASNKKISKVYIALNDFKKINTKTIFYESEKLGIKLKLVNDFSNSLSTYHSTYKDGFQFLSFRNEKLEEIQSRIYKRLFDIIFSSLVIIFILSWVYPILAIIIKSQSSGPLLFKQKRNGRYNSEFYCYKFRSMHINALSDIMQATRNDNRIFPFGSFMRRTNIDELPQFFNIFLGDMSVVGPRPHMLNHNIEFKKIIDNYMVRNFIKPGITGLAQISGFRGETKDIKLMEARVEKDIEYIENWSFAFDIKIIILTIFLTFKGDKNAF